MVIGVPKVDRKCGTPGCTGEGEVVCTGLHRCIYCQRELTVIEKKKPDTADLMALYPGIVDGMAGYLPSGD